MVTAGKDHPSLLTSEPPVRFSQGDHQCDTFFLLGRIQKETRCCRGSGPALQGFAIIIAFALEAKEPGIRVVCLRWRGFPRCQAGSAKSGPVLGISGDLGKLSGTKL